MPAARDETLSTTTARDRFTEVVDRAAHGKERVALTRRGKPVAAVVPIEDMELLESLEDGHDAALIRTRLAEWEAAGRPGMSLQDYIRARGLEVDESEA